MSKICFKKNVIIVCNTLVQMEYCFLWKKLEKVVIKTKNLNEHSMNNHWFIKIRNKKVSNIHLLYSVYFKFVFESISKLIISYTLQKTLLYLHNIENEEVKILKKSKSRTIDTFTQKQNGLFFFFFFQQILLIYF